MKCNMCSVNSRSKIRLRFRFHRFVLFKIKRFWKLISDLVFFFFFFFFFKLKKNDFGKDFRYVFI